MPQTVIKRANFISPVDPGHNARQQQGAVLSLWAPLTAAVLAVPATLITCSSFTASSERHSRLRTSRG